MIELLIVTIKNFITCVSICILFGKQGMPREFLNEQIDQCIWKDRKHILLLTSLVSLISVLLGLQNIGL